MQGLMFIDGALSNDPGALIDLPLFDADPGADVVLTADQWADLRAARRAAGQPLGIAGSDWAEEHGDQLRGADSRLVGEQWDEDQTVGDVHGCNAAIGAHAGTTMTGASFQGAP